MLSVSAEEGHILDGWCIREGWSGTGGGGIDEPQVEGRVDVILRLVELEGTSTV
jgi:hypothetical protein